MNFGKWADKSWIVLIGIVVIAVTVILFSKDGSIPDNSAAKAMPSISNPEASKISVLEKEIEGKIVKNLEQMDGVGRVQVSITLASGLKADYAQNKSVTKKTSKETDSNKGTREITEVTENNQLVMPNSASQPVVVMEERPAVAGVLVVAEGAKDPKIQEGIHKAVRTLLDIPASKVTVVPMGGV